MVEIFSKRLLLAAFGASVFMETMMLRLGHSWWLASLHGLRLVLSGYKNCVPAAAIFIKPTLKKRTAPVGAVFLFISIDKNDKSWYFFVKINTQRFG